MAQWVCRESVCKADQTLGEVVHGEPGDNLEVDNDNIFSHNISLICLCLTFLSCMQGRPVT